MSLTHILGWSLLMYVYTIMRRQVPWCHSELLCLLSAPLWVHLLQRSSNSTDHLCAAYKKDSCLARGDQPSDAEWWVFSGSSEQSGFGQSLETHRRKVSYKISDEAPNPILFWTGVCWCFSLCFGPWMWTSVPSEKRGFAVECLPHVGGSPSDWMLSGVQVSWGPAEQNQSLSQTPSWGRTFFGANPPKMLATHHADGCIWSASACL